MQDWAASGNAYHCGLGGIIGGGNGGGNGGGVTAVSGAGLPGPITTGEVWVIELVGGMGIVKA